MQTLIEQAREAQGRNLPMYAKILISDLARRLELAEKEIRGTRERAAKEVDELRTQLSTGPQDSDTFVSMPRTLLADDTYDTTQRPLGRGVGIEFRRPGLEEGEGTRVHWEDEDGLEGLIVHSMARLSVIPQDAHTVKIVER